MFEVGKKYQYNKTIIYVGICVYADNDMACFKHCTRQKVFWTLRQDESSWKMYPEYKEPKIEKVVRHLGRTYHSGLKTWEYKSYVPNYIGSFELTVTDGVLTDAKVITPTNP